MAELRRCDTSNDFEVWPGNMEIVDAFLAVATQWRTTGLFDGRVLYHGFDYAGVRAGLREAAIALSPAQWGRLQVMEAAAASALNGVAG